MHTASLGALYIDVRNASFLTDVIVSDGLNFPPTFSISSFMKSSQRGTPVFHSSLPGLGLNFDLRDINQIGLRDGVAKKPLFLLGSS